MTDRCPKVANVTEPDAGASEGDRAIQPRRGRYIADYEIGWDGETVTLPPAGPINPDGVSWARIRDEDGNGMYDLRLAEFADTTFAAHGKSVGTIPVAVVLIPRPDNPFDSDAVSIALPKSMGGNKEERCLGYLYRHTTEYWGIANDGRRDVVARLAAFTDDGEVHFTAIMSRDSDPADIEKYRCSDDEDGWDILYRLPEFSLDLPKARIMGAAIRDFLAKHESNSSLQNFERTYADEKFAAAKADPQLQWLAGLRIKLVNSLADEVVTHSRSNHHPALEVRRQGNFDVKVLNRDGGCVGRVKSQPDLVLVGNEFDRPAVIEALAREGIATPFDPAPGWLNASVEPKDGRWIHVAWRGRIAGLNVEPILASFEVATKELLVFASELRGPIEALLRRVGHIPEQVLLQAHPRDPQQFFGMDLIARLTNPLSARKLLPAARELIPEEWAELIEARWYAQQETRSRNALVGQRMLANTSPANRRPPDDPEVPPGLFGPPPDDVPTYNDRSADRDCCRLCGEAQNPYAEPSPYCLDCIQDARAGLFVDHGFNEAWHPAVIWSLKKLAEIEFGDAPAQDQLRTMPKEGLNSDLLMLCRMLTARLGYVVPGGHRKVYSWTDWLGESGLLAGGIRSSRGVTVMAKDGHICRSLLQRQVDDFFYENGIQHETEPFYPFDPEMNLGGYRADWRLADGTFVEALGFTNNPVYMIKAEHKIRLAKRYNIPIVTVTVANLRELPAIFAKWLPPMGDRTLSDQLLPLAARPVRRTGSADPPNPEWPECNERASTRPQARPLSHRRGTSGRRCDAEADI